MSINIKALSGLVLALGLSAIMVTSASAVKPRTCPDGTVVADSERCPKTKKPGPKAKLPGPKPLVERPSGRHRHLAPTNGQVIGR